MRTKLALRLQIFPPQDRGGYFTAFPEGRDDYGLLRCGVVRASTYLELIEAVTERWL